MERLSDVMTEASVDTDVPTVPPSEVEPPPISKNQLKRMRRAEYLLETKKARRTQEKERKKAAKRARITSSPQQSMVPVSAMSAYSEEEKLRERQLRKEAEATKFLNSCNTSFSVIIDCDFEAHHAERPIKSLAQQIVFCYGFNKRSANPVQIYLTGLGPKLHNQISKSNSAGWKGVTMTSSSYLDMPCFSKTLPVSPASTESEHGGIESETIRGEPIKQRQLVYLTSDAEEVLDHLDPNCAYIIGGIVDRNRLKGITHAKAVSQGLRTAKLPIKDHVAMASTHVLTVNHVFEILLLFDQTGSWKTTLERVLPQRKEAKLKGGVAADTAVDENNGSEDAGDEDEADSKSEGGPEAEDDSDNVDSS